MDTSKITPGRPIVWVFHTELQGRWSWIVQSVASTETLQSVAGELDYLLQNHIFFPNFVPHLSSLLEKKFQIFIYQINILDGRYDFERLLPNIFSETLTIHEHMVSVLYEFRRRRT